MGTRKTDTKDRIFEAALNLFSKNGFHGTTTRKIAILADVNEVTLFRHFKNKATLFKEIIDHVRRTNATIHDIFVEKSSPEDSLKGIVKNVLNLVIKYEREYKMILYGLLDQVEGFEEEIFFDYQTSIVNYLTPSIETLQKQGKIKTSVPAEQVSRLILSQILGVGNNLILQKKSIYKGQKANAIIDSIVELYLSK